MSNNIYIYTVLWIDNDLTLLIGFLLLFRTMDAFILHDIPNKSENKLQLSGSKIKNRDYFSEKVLNILILY